MYLLRLGFGFLLLGCMAVGQEHPAHLRGTWSNEQNEFKTLAISLRSDGQAVLHTAVIPFFARWSAQENSITLTVGMDGKSEQMQLTYDPVGSTLALTWQKSTQVLRKISDEEPPDWLAKSREKAAQAQAEQKLAAKTMMIREEAACANLEAAINVMYEKYFAPSESRLLEQIFLQHGVVKFTVSMLAGKTAAILSITYEKRALSKPSGYLLQSRYVSGEEDVDLPITYSLDARIRESINEYAESAGVRCSKSTLLYTSPFSPEKSYRMYSLRLSPERSGQSSQLENFLRAVWPDPHEALKLLFIYRPAGKP